jgi:Holliday junction resolvase RusA-like endonuclease
MIQVIIPGQPQAKGRAKIVKIGGFSRMATPAKTVAYEGLVALCAQEALRGAPLFDGPVRVRMNLWCQTPKSLTKRERADIATGAKRPTTKPDIDNVVKAIFDGFNGVLWRDDVQVVELTVSKHYAPNAPSVVVNVESIVVADLIAETA